MGYLKAASQIAGVLLLAAIMFPLFVIGLFAGISWVALYAGFVSWQMALDWITEGRATWQIKLSQKAKP